MKKSKSTPSSVTLIPDPNTLASIVEVSDAQLQEGELDLNEPELEPEIAPPPQEELDRQLEQVSEALKEEIGRQTEELREELKKPARRSESAARLAAQIAEDIEVNAMEVEGMTEASDQPESSVSLDSASLDADELQAAIETLLFLSDAPVTIRKLRELLGEKVSKSDFDAAVAGLKTRFAGPAHGIELVEVAEGLQLRTKPGQAAIARKLAKIQPHKLSRGAMETLAIIAYRQPVMKEDVDAIRGVDTSYFLRGLLEKQLIEITGRSELPGRPMLYGTTAHFMEIFGLKDLASLPPLQELERMIPDNIAGEGDELETDPRLKEMRKLVEKLHSTPANVAFDPGEDDEFLRAIHERVKSIPVTTPSLEEILSAKDEPPVEAAPEAAIAPTQPELAPEQNVET
jgi:segregation and condensation protein B